MTIEGASPGPLLLPSQDIRFALAARRRPCLNRCNQENCRKCRSCWQGRRGGGSMATSRRTFVKGSVATAATMCAPSLPKAQPSPSAARTVRAVLHGDLRIFDPIWTTANMTGNHGLLIYDTLFGMDDARNVQPQMVDTWSISDDRKTYTFTL